MTPCRNPGFDSAAPTRVCLNMLRSRRSRREEPLGVHIPDPIVSQADDRIDPEHAALLADSVGMALLVMLETLGPDERLAFVRTICSAYHSRSRRSSAARRLRPANSRAAPVAACGIGHRFRLQSRSPARSRRCLPCGRGGGDLDALLAILDPDVVSRADRGAVPPGAVTERRGARAVAEGALTFSKLAGFARLALVNGGAGIISFDAQGRPFAVIAFTVARGRIVEIDILADPARLRQLNLAVRSATSR
jgi:hypothetical protein